MDESITNELRDCIFDCPHLKGVSDRIDERFDRELTHKQDVVVAKMMVVGGITENEYALRLYESGMGCKEIGERLGCSHMNAVSKVKRGREDRLKAAVA